MAIVTQPLWFITTFVKSRRQIAWWNLHIALKFGKHLRSSATEMCVKFHCIFNSPNLNFIVPRLHTDGWCKKDVTPLLMHWSYVFLALTHRHDLMVRCFMSVEALLLSNQITLTLWPSDDIWWHRSGSTLVQVMACCLTALSHYVNQCWLIINKIQLHPSDGNFTTDTSVIND